MFGLNQPVPTPWAIENSISLERKKHILGRQLIITHNQAFLNKLGHCLLKITACYLSLRIVQSLHDMILFLCLSLDNVRLHENWDLICLIRFPSNTMPGIQSIFA